MKKQILFLTTILAFTVLAGCSSNTIVYEGKEMPRNEAEERIADKLEVENPDLDLEVNIVNDGD